MANKAKARTRRKRQAKSGGRWLAPTLYAHRPLVWDCLSELVGLKLAQAPGTRRAPRNAELGSLAAVNPGVAGQA